MNLTRLRDIPVGAQIRWRKGALSMTARVVDHNADDTVTVQPGRPGAWCADQRWAGTDRVELVAFWPEPAGGPRIHASGRAVRPFAPDWALELLDATRMQPRPTRRLREARARARRAVGPAR